MHNCNRLDDDGRPVKPDVATCGICGLQWCFRCDPGPSALCPRCHGRGHSTATLGETKLETWFEEDHASLDARGWYSRDLEADTMVGPYPTESEAVSALNLADDEPDEPDEDTISLTKAIEIAESHLRDTHGEKATAANLPERCSNDSVRQIIAALRATGKPESA